MSSHRSNERSVFALGPKIWIDFPEPGLSSCLVDNQAQPLGYLSSSRDRILLWAITNINNINVADIVQLIGTGLAHSDNR